MPLLIVQNDIAKMQCDAIVKSADRTLQSSCEPGSAMLTAGFEAPARCIIYTAVPAWQGGLQREELLLRSCYLQSLELAVSRGCLSVALPLLGAGDWPKEPVQRVALEAITGFLAQNELAVSLVVADRSAFLLRPALWQDLSEFIADASAAQQRLSRQRNAFQKAPLAASPHAKAHLIGAAHRPAPEEACIDAAIPAEEDLRRLLGRLDESFSQMLLRKIDESGMRDAECYKKANVDRKLFSKIRADVHYRPSKATALAFAIALELPLEETQSLLQKAGFALSHSSKFDLIIEYFIRKRNYNVFEINEALFAFDQPLLGG